MAKLGDFKSPVGNASGNIFSFDSWAQLILGGVMLIFTFAAAQNISGKVSGKVPFLDGQIEQPYTPYQQPKANNKRVY